MPRVNIPNLGVVNFPDSMAPADIEHEAGKLFLSYGGNLPGVPSGIPPKGQLPGNPTGESFLDRAAGRVQQNLDTGPSKLLEMFPEAVSRALQSSGKMSAKGKATLYPYGDSTPAKIAGIATVAQRQTYGLAKDLLSQWMADPANAAGDIASAALPLGDAKIPPDAKFAAKAATEAAPEASAAALLRREVLGRIPGAARVGVHKPSLAEYLDLIMQKARGQEQQPSTPPPPGGWANAPVDPALNLTEHQAWWKRRGGVLLADRAELAAKQGGDPFIRAPRPQPSVPAPPVLSNIARRMNLESDQAVMESMQADMARHQRAAAQEYRAANTVDTPKGVMAERLKAQLEMENMLRGAGPAPAPQPNMVPPGQRASDIITQAENEAIGNRVMARGETKAAIESGKVGTAAGAASDTALFQQAKRELPNGSVSDWAKRAQELKMKQAPTGTVKYTKTPPSPAKQNLNDPNTLMSLLKESVAKAKAKKPQPRPKK